MDGITDSMDVSLSKRRETVKDGESWLAAASPWGRRESVTGQWEISGVLQSDTLHGCFFFHILFHYGSLWDIECNSLCCIVAACYLSILHTVLCIY